MTAKFNVTSFLPIVFATWRCPSLTRGGKDLVATDNTRTLGQPYACRANERALPPTDGKVAHREDMVRRALSYPTGAMAQVHCHRALKLSSSATLNVLYCILPSASMIHLPCRGPTRCTAFAELAGRHITSRVAGVGRHAVSIQKLFPVGRARVGEYGIRGHGFQATESLRSYLGVAASPILSVYGRLRGRGR